VEVIDGSGQVWRGVVGNVSSREVELESLELLSSDDISSGQIVLIQSLCKADKLEWILQKSTELGISEIFLLEAERSVIKTPKERVATKLKRWQAIIQAAVKQSRRSTLPVLHPPQPLQPLCDNVEADLKLLLSESERRSTLKSVLRQFSWTSAVLCVGPEGGWTQQEQETLALFGFRPVSLGSNTLRTETAAIVATAILLYEQGGLGTAR
jgi:16S rRNA (uracil1498-N3)-methyltransferase